MTGDRKKQGYSLLELIVSISIIALLTGLFVANYHGANKRTDLTMAAQLLVTDFRYAQANALGLIKYDGEVPAGGWGLRVSSGNTERQGYTIFADGDDDQVYDPGEGTENLGGREVKFSPNIYIESISLDSGENSVADVTFLPPDPITRIKSGTATGTVLDIRLKEQVNNTTKTVRVNFLGLVEVID